MQTQRKRLNANGGDDNEEYNPEIISSDYLDASKMQKVYEEKEMFFVGDELLGSINSRFDKAASDMNKNKVCSVCDAIFSKCEISLLKMQDLPIRAMKKHLTKKQNILHILADYYDVSNHFMILRDLKDLLLSKSGIYSI